MASNFYVYVYFRRDGSPCYVGKGSGTRWSMHIKRSHNASLQKLLRESKEELPCVKIRQNMTETEAFALEIFLIKTLGRRWEGGPLFNKAPGGPGHGSYPKSEHKPRKGSEETKRKIGDANRGRKRTPEVVAAMRARVTDSKHFARMRAMKKPECSEETRQKLSFVGRGRKRVTPMSEEEKRRRSEAQKGKDNTRQIEAMRAANTGKRRSPDICAKIGAAHRGKKLTAEHREKLVKNHVGTTGKKWSDETKAKMSATHKARWAAKKASV